MAEVDLSHSTPVKTPAIIEKITGFARNPILQKEVRSRMRYLRTYVVMTVFLVLLSIGAGLVFTGLSMGGTQALQLGVLQRAGKIVFSTVMGMELAMVCLIAPALTAAAIAGERERQTFDLLRATLLSTTGIVLGKLASSVAFLLLLILSSLPFLSLAFLFGGVQLAEIVVGMLMLLVTALLFSGLGLFFSSLARRSLMATVLAYVVAGIWIFGLPVLLLAGISIIAPLLATQGFNPSVATEVTLITIGWFLVAGNPLATAIASEIGFTTQLKVFTVDIPLSNNTTYTLLSPWVAYVIGAMVITAVLVLFAIRFTDRPIE